MHITKSMDEIGFDPDTVVTVGAFDGVHLGHRAILSSLIEAAKRLKCRSVLVTFEPHPQSVMRPGSIRLLTTPEERLSLLEESNPDEILVLPFTPEFSQIRAERFIEEIVQRIGLRAILLGTGHTFGKGKQGGQDVLKKMSERYGFEIEVVPPVFAEDQPVSSTRIRKMLEDGKVAEAKILLGRWYSLSGSVTRGKGIGTKIGFPTANITVDHPLKLIPKDGIYAVRVHLDGETYPGACNIGFSPTLKGSIREIEVHIHDYSGEIYDHPIRIEFIARLRDELKFESIDDLIATIKQDKQKTIDIVSHA